MYKNKTHVRSKGRKGARKPAEQILAGLLEDLFAQYKSPIIIAVGGPGGTGKSTFSKRLAAVLPNSGIIRLDDYKISRKERAEKKVFGPHPAANKMSLIREHLLLIRDGESFEKPVYNSEVGAADSTESYTPAHFNILDGEVATYRQFRDLIDFSVFIDADWKTQLGTRISRDIEQRGYSREKAIATFLQSNLREFTEFGAESKNWADIHLYCRDDYRLRIESVSDDMYHRVESRLEKDLATIDISGLIVSVPTPFTDQDTLDQHMFIEHLEYLATNKVTRILVNGTIGEFFSLTPSERKILLELAREFFPGVILFQAGSDSLIQTREEAHWAEDFGADAILALPPYFYANAPETGLIKYFNILRQDLEIPLIITNNPQHTQNPLTPAILTEIDHFGLVDYEANEKLIQATPRYFVADAHRVPHTTQSGIIGFVCGVAAIDPGPHVQLERMMADKTNKAILLKEKINETLTRTGEPNRIAKIKQALSEIIDGYPAHVRLPLVPLPPKTDR